mmetsp:Transcript_4691/g.8292  ORF Transcript_4691/g.8292 Transcript_4691/m.8292 type:complete len:643 (-) Transcript_4691:83-2011(-)
MSQVIVVGGGLAGHSAAHTVLQNGGSVLLLDKSSLCGGNSTKATSGINAGGTRFQRATGIPDTPELFEKDTTASALELARPDLIKVLTHESAPAIHWLADSFDLDLTIIARLAAHSEPRTHRGKERFPGMAITYGLMEALEAIAEKEPSRARILNKATVTELIQDDSGEVVGVVFTKGGKSYKEYGPVVISTGGFGADFSEDSLLSQVSAEWDKLGAWSKSSRAALQSAGMKVPSPNLMTLPTTNGAHCTGDGIKLSLKAGAGTYDLEAVQVHPTGLIDPDDRDAKVKFLAAEALRGSGGIVLDRDGKRFCDELGKRDYVTGRMWLHNKAPYRLCLNSKAANLIMWHCEHYEGRGLMKKMSGADLAKACNVSKEELDKEFAIYNKAAENPGTDKWDKKFFEATPVKADDTFYVAEITPVVHYCMGGVAGNKDAAVITPNGEPINGLYVAGEALGGVHGVNRLGGSSLLDCVVFGRVAGRSAAKQLMTKLSTGGGAGGASAAGINVKISPQDKSVTVSWGESSGSTGNQLSNDDKGSDGDENADFYAQGVTKKAEGGSSGAASAVTMEEVAKHTTREDCWVVLYGEAYNVSSFLEDHPGGAKAIMLYAGKDATKEFAMLHQKDVIAKYIPDLHVGTVAGAPKL